MSLEEKIALERKDAKDEGIAEGMAKGKQEEREDNIHTLMKKLKCSEEKARELLRADDTPANNFGLQKLDL